MHGLLHALKNADATGPALIVCMIVLWYGIAWRVLVLSAWRPNRLVGAGLGWQANLPFGRALAAIRAEALTATELGLVVAVPGLLIGSLLERRQHQLTSLLELEVERVVSGATC